MYTVVTVATFQSFGIVAVVAGVLKIVMSAAVTRVRKSQVDTGAVRLGLLEIFNLTSTLWTRSSDVVVTARCGGDSIVSGKFYM